MLIGGQNRIRQYIIVYYNLQLLQRRYTSLTLQSSLMAIVANTSMKQFSAAIIIVASNFVQCCMLH